MSRPVRFVRVHLERRAPRVLAAALLVALAAAGCDLGPATADPAAPCVKDERPSAPSGSATAAPQDTAGETDPAPPGAPIAPELGTPDVTPPSPPAAVRAEGRPGGIAVSWARATDDVGVVRYEVQRDGATVGSGPATQLVDRGLPAATRHCYEVIALDAAGNRSRPGGPACAEPPDVAPPSVPAGLRASGSSETALDLAWAPSTDDVGVSRYEILDERGAALAQRNATRFTLNGLSPGVERCLAVRACDLAGNCSAPSRPACAAPPDLTPPTAPASLSAVAVGDRRVELRWRAASDNAGVARYAVRRDGATVIVVEGGETTALDEHAAPGVHACFDVVAEDAAGNVSSPSPRACATPPDLAPPTVPSGVAVRARSGTRIAIAWGASSDDVGVAGYEIVRDGAAVQRTERLQATVGGLAPGAETCWSVRALDAAGNRSVPSKPACASTREDSAPTAPWDLRVGATKARELVLAWEPSPDPGVVYAVYWDARSTRDRRIATTPASTFRLFGQPAADRHCYRVTAVDAAGRESDATFEACGRAGSTVEASASVAEAGLGSP